MIYFIALFFMVDASSQEFQDALTDMQAAYPDYTFVSNPSGYAYNATSTTLTRFGGFVALGDIVISPGLVDICLTSTNCYEFDMQTEILLLSLFMIAIFVIGLALKLIPWFIDLIDAVIPF